MEAHRVQVRGQVLIVGLSPAELWELLVRTTVEPSARVTAAVAPYFLDTEQPGALRSGMRREIEEVAAGLRVELVRWVECPAYVASHLEGHHTDQLAAMLGAFRRAVSAATAHAYAR